MKKRGLAAALAMLTMATTGTAFAATSYWIPVYYNNEGYNSTPVKKVIPADHAYVKALGSNHNELPTNYIVIANASDDVKHKIKNALMNNFNVEEKKII